MSATFYYGASVPVKLTFRDAGGSLVDPDTVTARAEDPDGTEAAIDVTRISQGTWKGWVQGTKVSLWKVRGVGTFDDTPDVVVPVESEFTIKQSHFIP